MIFVHCIVEKYLRQNAIITGNDRVNAFFKEDTSRRLGKAKEAVHVLYKKRFIVTRTLLEWVMSKKQITQTLIRAVMRLYKGAKTKVNVRMYLYEEFEVNLGVHCGLVFAICSMLL